MRKIAISAFYVLLLSACTTPEKAHRDYWGMVVVGNIVDAQPMGAFIGDVAVDGTLYRLDVAGGEQVVFYGGCPNPIDPEKKYLATLVRESHLAFIETTDSGASDASNWTSTGCTPVDPAIRDFRALGVD